MPSGAMVVASSVVATAAAPPPVRVGGSAASSPRACCCWTLRRALARCSRSSISKTEEGARAPRFMVGDAFVAGELLRAFLR